MFKMNTDSLDHQVTTYNGQLWCASLSMNTELVHYDQIQNQFRGKYVVGNKIIDIVLINNIFCDKIVGI